jgi:hypothetical protein
VSTDTAPDLDRTYRRYVLTRTPARALATALITAAISVPVAVIGAAPAQAAVTGTTSASDVTLRNSCRRIPIDYNLEVDPGTTNWRVRIKVETPDDNAPEGFDLSSEAGDPTTGTLPYLICGSDSPGTYRVQGVGTYQNAPLTNIAFELAESTFEVRRSPTRTSLRAVPGAGDRVRLVATVQALRKGDFRPVSNAPVRLQRLVQGRWRFLDGTRRLTNSGRAVYLVDLRPGTRVRAVTAAQGFRARSASSATALPG